MPQRTIELKIHEAVNQATGYAGVCLRNVLQLYANQDDILSTTGSLRAGGRYNYKEVFGVIYLSHEVCGCFAETSQSAAHSEFVFLEHMPRTVIAVRVTLSKVLDLTNSRTRRSLGIGLSVLRAPGWERVQEEQSEEAPTQSIGRYAYEAGFEAIMVPSAAFRGANLDVFPDNLLDSSKIGVVNQAKLLERRTFVPKP